mmetsp:Transcript_30170/g.46010  ORF Transcript_30170/g.46010 Transcript_30170/m.46010 type:complete len:474 (-) Transcript_30170:5308-6729(-)
MDESHPEWWENAVTWIRSNGGTVHPSVSVSSNRELIVVENVEKDTILLELPPECIPSFAAIQSHGIGKQFCDYISNLNGRLYNDEQDLSIAFVLAYQMENDDIKSIESYRPYLDTLPKSESFNYLPRRWSQEDLRLLRGSRLLDRIDNARSFIENDYKLISRAWSNSDFPTLPNFETFDSMLAVVTSRAFAGMGQSCHDKDIAMLPLIDLCNHYRGGDMTKNASYTKDGTKVQLTSCVSLEKGSIIRLTYGAKGNAQLLMNYGFTIPKNLEKDGSSNDVVEIKLKNGCSIIELRTGPKSYSFGCFSRAVEQFHAEDDKEIDLGGPPADFEEFINDCEGDFEDFEMEENDMEEDEEVQEKNDIEAEIVAIRKLESALAQILSKYRLKGSELENLLEDDTTRFQLQKKYAAILIHTELRTIQFYRLSCRRVLEKLKEEEKSDFDWGITLEKDDKARLQQQAAELCEVFIQIRSLQ